VQHLIRTLTNPSRGCSCDSTGSNAAATAARAELGVLAEHPLLLLVVVVVVVLDVSAPAQPIALLLVALLLVAAPLSPTTCCASGCCWKSATAKVSTSETPGRNSPLGREPLR